MFERTQHIAQSPAAGGTVGGSTVLFGWFSDLATVAEQVGMIIGTLFTICLFSHWLYKRVKEFKSSK